MIVPSMNSEELANEILSDQIAVLKKAKYLTKDIRREAIKSKNKYLSKTYEYKSIHKNDWLITVEYNNGDPLILPVVYFFKSGGLTSVLVLSGRKTLVQYSPHFLQRFNERFLKQDNITKLELLKRFLPQNNIATYDITTYDGGVSSRVFARFKEGIGLGTCEQLKNFTMVYLKTYISPEMIKESQGGEFVSISNAFDQYWDKCVKNLGKDYYD